MGEKSTRHLWCDVCELGTCAVINEIDAKTIKRKAMAKGMSSLRSDGARKVMRGLTSVAEIVRATEEEGVVAQV